MLNMAAKVVMMTRDVNGVPVEQRQVDGYVNATALVKAYEQSTSIRKDVRDWLLTERAKAYIELLSVKTGIPVLTLAQVKRGGTTPGTWIHPKLSVPFGTWLSVEFEMLVAEWYEEWMVSRSPSQLEADADRVQIRDELKDKKRLELTGQIKAFLQAAGQYKPGSYHTNRAFWEAHDKLNILLSTETAEQMRDRLQQELGRTVSGQELLRDYFPILDLVNYAALCQAAANEMAVNKTSPLLAIDIAARQVLPQNYVARPIDFTERIGLVRQRLEQRGQLLLTGR
jgi:hypothetical protein